MLSLWILKRIARGPAYGYELLTEIEQKTHGAWRPGPGSVYPLLKALVQRGFIESEKAGGRRSDQRRYRITRAGEKRLQDARKMYRLVGERWNSLRGIFADLIDQDSIADFLVEGSRKQFETAKEVFEVNRGKISPTEMRYMLGEYSLLLERQLQWASQLTKETPVSRARR